jgi:hypothetical protein
MLLPQNISHLLQNRRGEMMPTAERIPKLIESPQESTSWNFFGYSISLDVILKAAQAFVDAGLN